MSELELQRLELVEQIKFSQLVELYELIPSVLFWIKDKEGHVVHCNKIYVEHVGKQKLAEVIGKTDYDFSPKHIAKQYIVDDKKVANGEEVTDRLELNVLRNGRMAWFTTSKRPIYSNGGEIIGTYGISRHLEDSTSEPAGMGSLQRPVDFIRTHYADEINVKDLAEHCHLSVSALERRFKKYIGKTPLQFINEVRLEHARQLLVESNLPISQVASSCGFSDHSYFSNQFSKTFEILPSEFRKRHSSALKN